MSGACQLDGSASICRVQAPSRRQLRQKKVPISLLIVAPSEAAVTPAKQLGGWLKLNATTGFLKLGPTLGDDQVRSRIVVGADAPPGVSWCKDPQLDEPRRISRSGETYCEHFRHVPRRATPG